MTLGDKIRKYRIMNDLTQKELGIKVGFSSATADSRIRKYEKDLMAPKEDIRNKLAEALDVDLSALSDIDIQSLEDVIQVLFLFEEEFDMTIERSEEKTSLCFDNKNKDQSLLNSYLYTWFSRKKSTIRPDGSPDEEACRQYERWKARFPQDNQKYWADQLRSLNALFDPFVQKTAEKNRQITMLSEFLEQIRDMIRHGIQIEASVKAFGVGDSGLVLTFLIAQLLSSESSATCSSFAGFLYNIRVLESYGMPVTTTLLTNEKGTQVAYCLRLSPLSALTSTISKLQAYENEPNKNDWDIQMFEEQYKADLKLFELNLKEEIERRY